ncbi:MAG: SsrA-binding protein SmpB [Myxococcota bacterium]
MSAKAKRGDGGSARIATNRRAHHIYEILDVLEAGIELRGPEVKSLRAGHATLTDGFAFVRGGELFLRGVHISPYAQAGRENADPDRERRLLLHRQEISRLAGKVTERGLTLVPLSLYWKNGRAKVELALARGRKTVDRREAVRKREHEREMDRARRQRR